MAQGTYKHIYLRSWATRPWWVFVCSEMPLQLWLLFSVQWNHEDLPVLLALISLHAKDNHTYLNKPSCRNILNQRKNLEHHTAIGISQTFKIKIWIKNIWFLLTKQLTSCMVLNCQLWWIRKMSLSLTIFGSPKTDPSIHISSTSKFLLILSIFSLF